VIQSGRVLASARRARYLIRPRPPQVRQHGTHRELVEQVWPPPKPAWMLDAIIVPAARPAVNLDHAVTLARTAGCQLVVLCSREAHSDQAERLLASRSFERATVIDMPKGYTHPLLGFDTSRSTDGPLPDACADYESDLAAKRNIGLLLARMLGWKRVFFLDDDIRDISSSDLHWTVSMLADFHSVGMQVDNLADNSIVCHALRMLGGEQDIFVSGAALAVNCDAPLGFFPDIYNEDWFFFYNHVVLRKLASSGRNATQLRYDLFAQPQRAAWQEFGDVLAEGLYSLLHEYSLAAHAEQGYWARFLNARRGLLKKITAACSDGTRPDIPPEMVVAVDKALECSEQIRPEECARYVKLWLGDLGRWERRLRDMPSAEFMNAALRKLDLRSADGGGVGRIYQVPWRAPDPGPEAAAFAPQVTDSSVAPACRVALVQPGAEEAGPADTTPLPVLSSGVRGFAAVPAMAPGRGSSYIDGVPGTYGLPGRGKHRSRR
jgi:hypothetical protein